MPKAIINVLPTLAAWEVRRVEDLNKEEVKRKVIRQVEQDLSKGSKFVQKSRFFKRGRTVYEKKLVTEYKKNIIKYLEWTWYKGETRASSRHSI